MVQILPLRDRALLERLNQQEHTSAGLAYCLHDAGEITGWLLYDLTSEQGVIHAVHAPDPDAFDGLVRAALASLDDAGIPQASFDPDVDRTLLHSLNLLAEGADCVSIREILYPCGGCRGCACKQ